MADQCGLEVKGSYLHQDSWCHQFSQNDNQLFENVVTVTFIIGKVMHENPGSFGVRYPVFWMYKWISNLVSCTKIFNFDGYYHQSDPLEIFNKHQHSVFYQKHFNCY